MNSDSLPGTGSLVGTSEWHVCSSDTIMVKYVFLKDW